MTSAPPQYMQALQTANQRRLGFAALKRELHRREITLAEALDDPRALGKLTIYQVLSAQLRWGRTRTLRFLRHVAIPEMRRIEDLTDRQRTLILTHDKGFSRLNA
jgi:hypothetical protein